MKEEYLVEYLVLESSFGCATNRSSTDLSSHIGAHVRVSVLSDAFMPSNEEHKHIFCSQAVVKGALQESPLHFVTQQK